MLTYGRPQSMTHRPTLRTSSTVFLVGDIAATIPWYVSLGFTASPFPPSPPHTFAILRRDRVEIMLQQLDGYVRPDHYAQRSGGVWNLYIETDNVVALYETFSERGMKIICKPHRQPYGQIELEVADPNGYVLVFAQPT